MKKIIILVLVLAGAATGGWFWWNGGGDTAVAAESFGDSLFSVARGDLVITITENGTLVAKESQNVASEIRGRSKIEWLIEEGKTVEEGEVVCRLDTTELKKEVEQIELTIVQTEANLDTAETDLEIQKTDNVGNIETAQIALDKARKELERYTEGDAPKERDDLLIAIKDAETQYSLDKRKFEDSVDLEKEGFVNKAEVEQDQIAFERSEVRLKGAKNALKMYDKYKFPMDMTDKNNAVSNAERALDTAEKRASSQLRQKEVQVEQVKKSLEKYKEQHKEKTEMIDKSELKAPCPGIVIYGDPKEPWYTDEIKVGGDIWGSRTLVTIPDLRVMQVKLSVHEADINKLDEEQLTKVTMDTYPGMVLDGKVSKIASIAGGGSNPWESQTEVKKFAVEVTMDETDDDIELKPGISAKAEIFIEEKKDVIYVPIQCVFLEEGKHFCYVKENGAPTVRPVKPGSNNDTYIEILEGLEENERVLLYNPNLPTGPEEKTDDEPADDSGDEDDAGSDESDTPAAEAAPVPTVGS